MPDPEHTHLAKYHGGFRLRLGSRPPVCFGGHQQRAWAGTPS